VEFYCTSQQFVAIVTIISTPTDPAVKTDKKADYAVGVYCSQIASFYVIHLIYLAVKTLQQEMSGAISHSCSPIGCNFQMLEHCIYHAEDSFNKKV